MSSTTAQSAEEWPALALEDWKDSYETVHLWTQLLGKTRLALSAPENHWWHTALYVSAHGLTTSAMQHDARTIDIELDFVDHRLIVRCSDGRGAAVPLDDARTVANAFSDYIGVLRSCDVDLHIWPMPVEIPGAVRFTDDRRHTSYDAEAVARCWRILANTTRVLEEFRGDFLGKCSPAHFWWGAFDVACTRFSGRAAPPHPGGIPGLADHVAHEAYSHECISAGWWPGSIGGALQEPAFYAYAYPEPPGCATAAIRPAAAYYHDQLREWILPYEAMRTAADPAGALRDFLDSTYGVAADLGTWDRAALERNQSLRRA